MPQALVSSEKHLASSESILAILQPCVHSKGVQNQASLWPGSKWGLGGPQSKLLQILLQGQITPHVPHPA